jgi:hypothetical protein
MPFPEPLIESKGFFDLLILSTATRAHDMRLLVRAGGERKKFTLFNEK